MFPILRSSAMLVAIAFMFTESLFAFTAKNCKVTFQTKGKPVLIIIEGYSIHPCEGEGSIKNGMLTDAKFVLNLSQIETGIPLRNRHLRDNYLHTEKYPEATLVITNADDFAAQLDGASAKKSTFAGTLVLHGNEKLITDGEYQIKGKLFEASFSIDLPEFGVERPAFMGIKVVDRVFIQVGFEIDGT